MIRHICIFLCAILVSSLSQILLKKSAFIKYENKIREYMNARVLVAYGLFFMATLATVYAYKTVPLSMGPILEASGYVWVAVLSRIFLGERIKPQKIIGLLVILSGIMIFAI